MTSGSATLFTFRDAALRQWESKAIPACRKPTRAPSGKYRPIGQMTPAQWQSRPAGFYARQKSGCRNADKTSA